MLQSYEKKSFFLPVSKKKSYLCIVIQLGRHIEILLLDNDCVIVPDFGGFVAHHVSARYDEDDHSWLPPMRTLGFNAQLRINDSLLAQSYVNAYDISYPEALRRIEDEVEELKQLLANEGCYTMDNIGTLTINDEGNYQFEPCEAGILSPTYYGLDACRFDTLKDARDMDSSNVALQMAIPQTQPKTTDEPALLDFTDNGEQEDERIIHIRMSWVRNIVAVAAAVIAFFVMATPIANSDLGTRTMSDLKGNLIYKLIPQDTNMAPATPIAESVQQQAATTAEASDTTKTDEVVKTAKVVERADAAGKSEETATASGPTYCIVLASHVRKSNAETYIETLKKQGYNAEIYVHNNVVRVIYGSFESESEAYKQLNRLNDKEEFYDAWVYKKKSEA